MIEEIIDIPEGVEVEINNRQINVKGPKGELSREYPREFMEIKTKDKSVVITGKQKKCKSIVGTFRSHIQNMIKGVQEEFVYKLRVCFSHFPTSVDVSGNKFIIKNYLGGSKTREIKIPDTVKVSVKDKDIEVKSIDKEMAGSFAGTIEQKTKAKGKDLRSFQDGCYIISKAGKEV